MPECDIGNCAKHLRWKRGLNCLTFLFPRCDLWTSLLYLGSGWFAGDTEDMLFVVMGWTLFTWPPTFYNDVWAYDVAAGVVIFGVKKCGKQMKISMEPQNHRMEKYNHLPSLHFLGVAYEFSRVFLIFVGKWVIRLMDFWAYRLIW